MTYDFALPDRPAGDNQSSNKHKRHLPHIFNFFLVSNESCKRSRLLSFLLVAYAYIKLASLLKTRLSPRRDVLYTWIFS